MYINLILSFVWFGFFLVSILTEGDSNLVGYGWLVFATYYLIVFIHQKNKKYVSIENGIIKINSPFGKKLEIEEIKQIKKFAGDYILKSDNKELVINTLIIDPNSLNVLDTELEKLNIAWS